MNKLLFTVLFTISFVVLLDSQEAFAEPANTLVEVFEMDATTITFRITDPDGLNGINVGIGGGGGGIAIPCSFVTEQFFPITKSSSIGITISDCQDPSDTTDWLFTEGEGIQQVGGIPFQPQLVGGVFIPIDTTSLLLAGTYSNASWLIPVIVAGIGIGFVILRKF